MISFVLEEVSASGAVVAKYTMGLGVDEPIAMARGGATYYYGQDGLGSVTSLFSTSAAVAATYTYDAYGKLTATTGSVANPYLYTGREFDVETRLYGIYLRGARGIFRSHHSARSARSANSAAS